MTTRKERKAARKQAKQSAKAERLIRQSVGEYQRREAKAIATKQYIALMDSPHSKRCPVTGHPVDLSMLPANITGPYYSVPFGNVFKGRKRSKWTISPVSFKSPDGRINPCVSVMWARVEVAK